MPTDDDLRPAPPGPAPPDDFDTVRDLIRWGASRMADAGLCFGHGTDNALDESAALTLHALRLPPDLPDAYLPARVAASERDAVAALLHRRIRERLPLPYLTRRAWFMGLPFYVDERVLIPRSPLAELIEQRFAPWLDRPDEVGAILDLCCGSGCLGIACAYAFPNADVDLADVSADALAVADRNVAEHGLGDRVQTLRSDLWSALENGGRRYRLIVSNPPYVAADEMATLPAEYRHEPALALAAGDQGLDCVSLILRRAAEFLSDDGLLVVEVGSAGDAVTDAYPDVPFVWPQFERGGGGVFVLDAGQLRAHADAFY